MTDLPKEYEKYDEETQEALSDLLESIDHIVHIMNGVRADIINGNYHARPATRLVLGTRSLSLLDRQCLSLPTLRQESSPQIHRVRQCVHATSHQ